MPIAIWIVISGLDDLFITLVWFATSRHRFPWPADHAARRLAERPIALFVPLWHEHAVIGRMLKHNLAAIEYRNYQIFVGVYPNDLRTLEVVEEAALRDPRVHVALCPHDGPTSKGDCLNWIFQRMKEHEQLHGGEFQVVVMHDAEDVIHPESLRIINWFSRRYAMVQVPVLPLPTRLSAWTHGLYCDEFAEYQCKDIPVRQVLGGFLPSNGVGTGFAREAMNQLADERGGRPFDPACLTEDYETGYLLHSMGFRQIFVPLRLERAAPLATREFFPRRIRTAIRQRTRWVTGISLQSWERHGWRVPWRQGYWFWRDRKGLLGNLLSPFANLFFLYGLAGYLDSLGQSRPWQFGALLPVGLAAVCQVTFGIAMLQGGARAYSAGRIYGWRFATGVPVRMVLGNLINFAATATAIWEFWEARARGRGLAWNKTEHVYPVSQGALTGNFIAFQPVVHVPSSSAGGD